MRIMYDSVTASKIPSDAQLIGGYVDGMYAWSAEDWANWSHVPQVRIAVFPGTDDGNCADVEQFDMTPQSVVGWVQMRRRAGVDPSVYCSRAPWPTVRQAFDDANEPQPHYWIADWDGLAVLPVGAVAHQYVNGPDFDTSVVADYWPGVDPAPVVPAPEPVPAPVEPVPAPEPAPTPPAPPVPAQGLTEADVIAIIDRYLAAEIGQGSSAQLLIEAILARLQAASDALNLNRPAPPKP